MRSSCTCATVRASPRRGGPVPHARFGEVPFAFLVTSADSDATKDQVIAFCRRHLVGFKISRHFRFVAGLPRGGARLDMRPLCGATQDSQ